MIRAIVWLSGFCFVWLRLSVRVCVCTLANLYCTFGTISTPWYHWVCVCVFDGAKTKFQLPEPITAFNIPGGFAGKIRSGTVGQAGVTVFTSLSLAIVYWRIIR